MLFIGIVFIILFAIIFKYLIQAYHEGESIIFLISICALLVFIGIIIITFMFKSDDAGSGEKYNSGDFLKLKISYYTISRLNLRSGPSTSYNVQYVLPKGEKIIVNRPFKNKNKWVYAETVNGNYKGYVSSKYIRSTGDRDEIDIKGKYFFRIFLTAVKSLFSWITIVSLILTIISTIIAYNGSNSLSEFLEEKVGGVVFAISFIIIRGFKEGVPAFTTTVTIEYTIFFVIAMIIGSITATITKGILDC